MVVRKTIVNAKGEPLKTKEGIELEEFRFEEGDVFIPVFNKVYVDTKGKHPKYNLLCKVKSKGTDIVINNEGKEEIFVTLTPAQHNTITKKLSNNEEINQHLFSVYTYEKIDPKTKNVETFLGVGYKTEFKPAKSFADFEEE